MDTLYISSKIHFIYFFGSKNKITNLQSSFKKCMVTLRNNCIFTLHKSVVNETYLACNNNCLISTLQLRNFSSVSCKCSMGRYFIAWC